MSHVVVTLKYQATKKDLSIPVEVPIKLVTRALAEKFGVPPALWQSCALTYRDKKELKELTPEKNLLQSSILYGYTLELIHSGHKATSVSGPGAMLETEQGASFHLKDSVTVIGRFAPQNREIDIDLTPLDTLRLISRRHVSIERSKDQYMILDLGSRNGTLVNNVILQPHQGRILQNGDQIRCGGTKGILLIFKIKG